MSGAFDGTGNASEEPSFRAGLIMVLLIVAVVAGLLLVASGALNGPGARDLNTTVNPPLLQSAPAEN
ncbi:MAG: hypothetical protein ABI864_02625 [Chloroflexota bacterium]